MSEQDLKPKKIREIADHLMIEQTRLYPADLAFVFGSKSFCDELAVSVARHYHAGYFNHIVVSGAPITKKGLPEAHHIFLDLVKKGVYPGHILIEDQATNTQENIELAKPLIERVLGLEKIKTIIGFGQLYAARRYLMTLKRRWPEVMAMHVSVNGFPAGREDWHRHEEMRRKILSEWHKQTAYKEKDFIREIDVDEINEAVHIRQVDDRIKHKHHDVFKQRPFRPS